MLDNQTLQDKYPHLEVSVLKLSEVKKDNESFRIDSEPYKKSNMYFNSNFSYVKLSEIAIINPSKTEIQSFSKNTQITFLSMQNLGNGTINEREQGTILEFESGYTYFAENDILIAKITPCMEHGKCAIATDLCNGIGFGSTEFNVFRIKDERFIKEFVFCYLNRESIRKIATDNMVGTSGRQRVPTSFYEKLLIPIFPMPFQLEIEKLVKDSHKALESSKALYKEAEVLLYEALGLDPKNPLQSILHSNYESLPYRSNQNENSVDAKSNQIPNTTIATLKESFIKTGRLDAEYYQSKYEDIETKIHNFPTIKLKDLVQYPITSGATPKAGGSDYTDSKNGIPFLRAVDLKNARVDIANLLYIKPETHEKSLKRTKLMKGDILFSIAGVIGRCAIFDYAFEANINQALAILRFTESKKIKRLYLIAFFNSQFGQMYLERYSRQGLQTNLNLDEVGNLEIPIIDSTTQESIAKHLQKSFELRAEAKKLLESAKAEVESALNNANNGGGGGKTS